VPIAGMLAWKVQASSGKADVLLPLISRPSLLVAGATGRMATIALTVLVVVGGFFLIVEAVSLFSSFRLTRAITGSVDDLYRGTLQVAEGDFSHQIPVRGEHQLSELATSFNSMTAKIRQMIGDVKKKEKLDAELEIDRCSCACSRSPCRNSRLWRWPAYAFPDALLAVTITTICVWTTDGQLSRSGTFQEREFQRHS
jgi:HAMP domain-containing protein